jgi:uncharacterized protein YegL
MRYLRFADGLAMASPKGLAVDGPRLIVIDTGNHRVVSVDPINPTIATAILGAIAGVGPALQFPSASVVPAVDEIVVLDAGHHTIHHYARVGGVLQLRATLDPFATLAPVGELVDAAVDSNGDLLLLDRTNRRVLSVDLATSIVTLHLSDATWTAPSAIAVGGGYLWVADARRHTIDRYDAALQRQSFGRFGRAAGEVMEPNGLLFEATTPSLLVTEAVGGRVSRFDVNGQFIESCAVPIGSRRPGKMAVFGATLFVADEAANGLHLIDHTSAPDVAAGPFPTRLDFETVLVGASDQLVVQLRNPSSRDVTFTEIGLTGEGFALDPVPATPIVVATGTQLDLTVRFAPQVRGLRSGYLRTISTDESNPVGLVRLMGTGVEARPCAVALVLDTSGSMAQSSGALSKIERLRNACDVFLDLLSLREGDDLALVRFSSTASTELPLSAVTPSLLQTAEERVTALSPGGSTAIGAGLEHAFTELETGVQLATTSPKLARHVIVLTDGKQNVSPLIEAIERPPRVRTYALGLGLADNIDAEVLSALASESGGYLQTTDGADELLPKFFLQILIDINGEQTLVDPTFNPKSGRVKEFAFHVSEHERMLRALLTWDHADTELDMMWVLPTGRELPINQGVVRRGACHVIGTLPLRGRSWDIAGEWRLRVRCRHSHKGDVAVLAITTASDLVVNLRPRVLPNSGRKGKRPRVVDADASLRSVPAGVAEPLPAMPSVKIGDDLSLEFLIGRSAKGARVVGGHVTWWQPRKSRSEQPREAGKDADTQKDAGRREKGAWRTGRLAIKRIPRTASGVCSFTVRGNDGVHRLDIALVVRSARGHLTRRERTLCVLVEPAGEPKPDRPAS